MTRAFITGITGCVGSNLAEALLRRGVEVSGLCLPGAPTRGLEGLNVRLVQGNLFEDGVLKQGLTGADWVFHVAGIADDWNYPAAQVYRVNVEGTRRALEAAAQAGVSRFVYTSSAAVAGVPERDGQLLDENHPFNLPPADWIYGHSKVLAEQAVQEFTARGLHCVCVEPTAIFGPRDQTRVCGQIIFRIMRGELFPFPPGGANYIDVRDVAEMHIAAAELGQPGERFILSGHNLSHQDFLKALENALGVRAHYLPVPRALVPPVAEAVGGLIRLGLHLSIDRGRVLLSRRYMYYDNRRAAHALGLRPRPFEETLLDSYQWYVEQGMLEPRRARRAAAVSKGETR